MDEFERIADSLDDDQVELIDGYIVERDDMKPSHVKALGRVRRRLEPMLPAGWFIREEKPVRIPDFDQPRPDVAVVPGDSDFFGDRHPGPAGVALLIEVSDTSLLRDQAPRKSSTVGPESRSTGSSTSIAARSRSTQTRHRTGTRRAWIAARATTSRSSSTATSSDGSPSTTSYPNQCVRRLRCASSRLAADGPIQGASTMSSTVSTIAPTQPPAPSTVSVPESAHPVSEMIDATETLYRLTAAEYEQIAGFLDDDRVELIDGFL